MKAGLAHADADTASAHQFSEDGLHFQGCSVFSHV